MTEMGDDLEQMIDRLGDLYQEDPESFERLSRLLIQRTIESFPADRRQRAYGLQFRLEATLRHYKDPIARMNKMVEILWEQLRHFQEVMNDPAKALAEREAEKTGGKVIPFPRSKKLH